MSLHLLLLRPQQHCQQQQQQHHHIPMLWPKTSLAPHKQQSLQLLQQHCSPKQQLVGQQLLLLPWPLLLLVAASACPW
jgi:hypothetical protein